MNVRTQREIIYNHQKFLETLANKDRQCNIIVTGLAESENAESLLSDDRSEIVKIANTLLPGNEDANDMEIERLGKIETARNPRPIRVKFKSSVTRNKICANAKLLKNTEGYRKVYVKKGTHPAIRKENARIYKLVKDEKDRPENQGCNIFYDWKERVVKKGHR